MTEGEAVDSAQGKLLLSINGGPERELAEGTFAILRSEVVKARTVLNGAYNYVTFTLRMEFYY